MESNSPDIPRRPDAKIRRRKQSRTVLQDYLRAVRRHLILSIIAATVVSAYYVIKRSSDTPLYKSVAIVIYDPSKANLDKTTVFAGVGGQLPTTILLRNYLTELKSNSFRQRIIETLTDEEIALIRTNEDNIRVEQNDNLHQVIADANRINLAAGNIFQFEFHHPKPEAAAFLANRFSEELQSYLLERSRLGNAATLRFLRTQSEELKLKVERSELEIQRYRQERHLVSLEESQNLIVARMKDLSRDLHAAKMLALAKDADLDRVRTALGDTDELEKIPAVSATEPLPHLLKTREDLQAERSILQIRYGKNHPKMIENQSRLNATRSEIETAVQKIASDLIAKQEILQARVERLQSALREAENEALELDVLAIEYNVLRRKLETDKRLFSDVHRQLNEALIQSQVSSSDLKMVDRAWAASSPFSPNKKQIFAISGLLFLLTTTALPYLIERMDTRLKSIDDVESALGVPFLGEINRFPNKMMAPNGLSPMEMESSMRESFRQVQSHILMAIPDLRSARVIIVTSAVPGEGKSFFATHLAASFAQHNYKTLLIDCDFRKPSLVASLQHRKTLQNNGLFHVADMSQKLKILGRDKPSRDATELIESPELQRHLQEARKAHEFVIIDTPPSGLFPDAALLARFADYILFINELGHQRISNLNGILGRLENSKAELLGLIANKVPPKLSKQPNAYRYANYSKYAQYYNKTEAS